MPVPTEMRRREPGFRVGAAGKQASVRSSDFWSNSWLVLKVLAGE